MDRVPAVLRVHKQVQPRLCRPREPHVRAYRLQAVPRQAQDPDLSLRQDPHQQQPRGDTPAQYRPPKPPRTCSGGVRARPTGGRPPRLRRGTL